MPIGKGGRPSFLRTSTASHLGTISLERAWLEGLAICLRDSTVCQGIFPAWELPAWELLFWETFKALSLAEHLTAGAAWGLPAKETLLSARERGLSAPEGMVLPVWETTLSAWGGALYTGKAWETVLSAWERVLSAREACLPAAWGEAQAAGVACLPACLWINCQSLPACYLRGSTSG